MNPSRRRLFGALLGTPALLLPKQSAPKEEVPTDMLLQPYSPTTGFTLKWNALVKKVYDK